jgi:RHS repeat-associated protein
MIPHLSNSCMQASLVDPYPSVSICGLNGCYDDNGNMLALSLSNGTSMTNPGPVVTTYGYDYENRLTSVDSEAGYEAAYTYSADGLRLRVQESNAQYTDRWLQYDGVRPVLEGTLDGDTFTTTNRYVLEGDSYYAPLIFASIGGNNRYYLYDGLGSTRQLLDSDQDTTDTYQYEAFGNLMTSTGSTPNPYRYVGSLGYYQTGSSLMHLGARYYMPGIGRFIGPDPVTQGSNYYDYVGARPVGFVDPTGLFEACAQTICHDGMTCSLSGTSQWSAGFKGSITTRVIKDITDAFRPPMGRIGDRQQLLCFFNRVKIWHKVGTVTMIQMCTYRCPDGSQISKYSKETRKIDQHNERIIGKGGFVLMVMPVPPPTGNFESPGGTKEADMAICRVGQDSLMK